MPSLRVRRILVIVVLLVCFIGWRWISARRDAAFEAYMERSFTAYNQSQPKEAQILLENALKLKPHSSPALVALAQVYARQNLTAKAEHYFNLAFKNDSQAPKDAYARWSWAIFLYEYKGKKQEGEDTLRELVTQYPGWSVPVYSLAYINKDKKNYDEAERLYRIVADLDPQSPSPVCSIGFIRLKQHKLSEAKSYFKHSLAIDPKYLPALISLADVLALEKKYPEAEKQYRLATKVAPHSSGAFKELATFLAKRRRYPEAETTFKKSIEMDTNNIYSVLGLAYVEREQGDYRHAITLYREVIKREPKYKGPYLWLAKLLQQTRQPGAKQLLDKASKLDSEYEPHGPYY